MKALCSLLPLVPLLLGALAPLAGAQDRPVNETDPRFAKDPRDLPDPRELSDPREVEPDPLNGPPGPKLYDALYDSGQETRLKQAFQENGWDLLPYVESQCDAWLSLREHGDATSPTGQAQLEAAQDKARKVARFADETLLNTRFQRYVEHVLAWTDEQRAQFRDGQELYQEGVALMNAATNVQEAQAALTPLSQVSERARVLGDARTQVKALVTIGRLQASGGDERAAQDSMREAVRIGREVRDLDGVWSALSVLYESGVRTLDWDAAEEALKEQYLIAQDLADEQSARKVLELLVRLETWRETAR